MDEPDSVFRHYSEQLRLLIWSGFFDRQEFQFYLDDLSYDDDAAAYLDELRRYGEEEFARKLEAESNWPEQTDWDRLNDAFQALNRDGVLALHSAGYTSGDAHSDAWEMIHGKPGKWLGFCFYHGQDVERAVQGMPLFIGFDAVADSVEAKKEVGNRVASALRHAGFTLDWNGDPETRMAITNLDWKKRSGMPEQDFHFDEDVDEVVDAPAKPGLLARLFGKKT